MSDELSKNEKEICYSLHENDDFTNVYCYDNTNLFFDKFLIFYGTRI